ADDDHVLDVGHVWMLSPGSLRFTLYSSAALATPLVYRAAQSEERDHAWDQWEPERKGAEHEHAHHGEPAIHAERGVGADHPAFDASDAARDRQQVAEHADEEALDQDRGRRGVGRERPERRPHDGDLERPEEDRAEQRRIARAKVPDRVSHAGG